MGSEEHFLAGGGEMGARIRAHDWGSTPLGPPAAWPQSLRSAVSILLPSKAQIALFWGEELITLYNDAYRPVFGAKHPGALGQPIRQAWDELWRDGLKELFDGVLATGEAFWARDRPFFMERHGYLEETYFDVSYDPVRDESGNVGGVFCIVSETTGRVIGERRLQTLRDLGRIAGQCGSVREAFAAAARVLAGNPHDLPFALLYGERGADGTAPLLAWHGLPDDSPAAPQALPAGDGRPSWVCGEDLQVLQGDALAPFGPLRAGPWDERVRQAVVVPLVPQGERATGWLVAGISPRRRVDDAYCDFLRLAAASTGAAIASARRSEDERRRAEMLAELDRAKTTFFNNVSHEFRTPLALMLGPVSDALEDAAHALPPPQRERIETARRSALRLQKLVNTLLDFSRIEAGRAQACYRPTDLAQLTAELAASFRSAIEAAGLRLRVDCPRLPEPAWVDRDMWEKIVLNLLSNALKFTFEGEIAVSLRAADGAIELAVRDTGTGIAPGELPRVFERFHRVEGARSRTHEGTGIGLALVQELARLHGGEARVESEPGRGSCFTVRIPAGRAHLPAGRLGRQDELASTALGSQPFLQEALRWLPDAPQPEEEAAPPADPALPRARILLADDNADMRGYVRRLLQPRYQVETVADGAQALAAALARPPELLVADVMMPGLDGLELVRALRADPRTRTLPVLLLSARAGEESRIEGLEAGADDYLEKPFGARELLSRVEVRLAIAGVRRTAEAAVRARERQLRFVTDHVPVLIVQCDTEARYQFVNAPYAQRLGLRVEQVLGRRIPEVLGHAAFESIRPHVEAALRGERVEFDAHIPYEASGPRWMQCSYVPQHETDGRVSGFVGVITDVTERRQADRELKQQAARLEKLNQVGAALTAEPQLERVVQAVTDAATQLTGAQFGAFFHNVFDAERGASYRLFALSGAPREAFERFGMPRSTPIFGPTFAGEGIVRMHDVTQDTRYGRNPPHRGMPPGHLPVRSYLAAPVVSRTGEVLGGLFFGHPEAGVFDEAAERVVAGIAAQAAVAIDNARLHEQSQRLIRELREADRRKDEFIATLSHELRNPLAPLRNALHLMRLERGDMTEQVRAMMERQLNHLVRLVDDLLEISRISRGSLELRKEKVELATVVRNAVDTSMPLVREADHQLDLALPPDPLWLEGDPVRLAQILSNLLNNAARYTPAGGRIALAARAEGGEAVLSVRDNGHGFDAQTAAILFQMFSRGDKSSGLGIGLALSQRLARMHGGAIEAASAGPGQGAEFKLRLPLAQPPAEPQPRGAEREDAIPPMRILVADDNQDAGDTLRMLLEYLGAEVRVVTDGPQALDLFGSYDPHVVLLDIGMPGMDGYQVAAAIRERHPERHAALVALTGWGQEQDRRRGREAGFDHHLVKPADIGELQKLLTELARGQRTGA